MQGAVAVVVGLGDVVLPLDKLHVALAEEHLLHPVDIVDVAADHPDAGDVVDVLPGGVHGDGEALPVELLGDAPVRLQAALHMVDGVVGVADAELLAEDGQAGLDLPDGGAVEVLEFQKLLIAGVECPGLAGGRGIPPDGGKGLVHRDLLFSWWGLPSQYTTFRRRRKAGRNFSAFPR